MPILFLSCRQGLRQFVARPRFVATQSCRILRPMTTRLLRSSFLFSLLTALLFLQNAAFAHNALTGSVPGDGQTVSAPPAVRLEFNGAVSLLRLSLIGADGEVDIGFAPRADAAALHEVALPALAEGRYVVDWTVLGADGHRISKSFSFTVDATAPATGTNSTE